MGLDTVAFATGTGDIFPKDPLDSCPRAAKQMGLSAEEEGAAYGKVHFLESSHGCCWNWEGLSLSYC